MEGYPYWDYKNEDLVILARKGDEEAYKQLFYNLRPIMINKALVYKDKMPIYDMDDFLQEGRILVWKMVSRGKDVDCFAAYFIGAIRRVFSDLYYEYCKNNLIVIREISSDEYNTVLMVEADYVKCVREKSKKYNKMNIEKRREYAKKRREKHRDSINENNRLWMRKYREEHRDQINERKRKYWNENKEEINARRREYRRAHKEEVYAQNRAWRHAHRDEINARLRERRHVVKKESADSCNSTI